MLYDRLIGPLAVDAAPNKFRNELTGDELWFLGHREGVSAGVGFLAQVRVWLC